jgi:hypothetical protein
MLPQLYFISAIRSPHARGRGHLMIAQAIKTCEITVELISVWLITRVTVCYVLFFSKQDHDCGQKIHQEYP